MSNRSGEAENLEQSRSSIITFYNMKKLFFAVLLVTVAVGSAVATQTYSSGPLGTGEIFDCAISDTPTCREAYPDGAYPYPNGAGKVPVPALFYLPL